MNRFGNHNGFVGILCMASYIVCVVGIVNSGVNQTQKHTPHLRSERNNERRRIFAH